MNWSVKVKASFFKSPTRLDRLDRSHFRRRYYFDQHGRKEKAEIESKTGWGSGEMAESVNRCPLTAPDLGKRKGQLGFRQQLRLPQYQHRL